MIVKSAKVHMPASNAELEFRFNHDGGEVWSVESYCNGRMTDRKTFCYATDANKEFQRLHGIAMRDTTNLRRRIAENTIVTVSMTAADIDSLETFMGTACDDAANLLSLYEGSEDPDDIERLNHLNSVIEACERISEAFLVARKEAE